ncbi:MAG: AAA family ATPase [Thermodesulforhabdaceae bacterium]
MLETVRGEVERITFRSPDDGYAVLKILPARGKEPIVVVGKFMDINPGETIEVKGRWRNHPQHGMQLYAESYRTLLPASHEGIRKYLASGLIKGIGPVIAERIVERFGVQTFDVMENTPERLLEVEGIGSFRLEQIKKAWREQKDIRELMQFLQDHDIPTGYAPRIFKHYGDLSISILKENPYRVAMEVSGIGFLTADAIARKLGIPEDSPLRAQGAIFYMLQKLASEGGHTCFPEDELISIIEDQLKIPREVLIPVVNEMIHRESLVRDWSKESGTERALLYLPGLYTCEVMATKRLLELRKHVLRLLLPQDFFDRVEEKLSFKLDEDQRKALITALTSKITIITGGPGTGKTTLVKAITIACNLLGLRVLLASPTGRAAKRLEEVTRNRAATIHRLLEFSPRGKASREDLPEKKQPNGKISKAKEGGFLKNASSPLKGDMLILDETSMIDLPLLHHLLKAVPNNMSVVFVGDVDQLPSVGPGNVLRDLIESGLFTVVRLSTIHRQAKHSQIVVNAHRVIEGKMPITPSVKDQKQQKSDFYFIYRENPEEIASLIVRLYCDRIPKGFGFEPIHDIQVITPMNKGVLGSSNLNRLLQDALNPRGFQIERGGQRFRVNDKVMQTKNNYDKDVYNGDMGIIKLVDLENQEVTVDFYGRKIKYDFSELDELTLAYAISVHKSQGSEYPAVIIPVVTQHYVMLQRNLLYTAITRGKKLVVLVGTHKATAIAVRNSSIQRRFSLFKERLKSQLV